MLSPFERVSAFDGVAPSVRGLGVRPGIRVSASCDRNDFVNDEAPRIRILALQVDWLAADSAGSSAFDCCFVSCDELVSSCSVLSADVGFACCHLRDDSISSFQSTTSIPSRSSAVRNSAS